MSVISRALTIADLRLLAQRRLPRVVFDYIEGGADAERTLRENSRVFDDVTFRPRGAVANRAVSLRTTVLGQRFELPFLLAPIGSSRMFYPRAEELAAAAAGDAGTGYILSTLSGCRLEDVKAATPGPAWYQVYLVGGRSVAEKAIARAKAAGFTALVVTVDTPVAGNRLRDPRNGTAALLSGNPVAMLPHVGQVLTHPRWLAGFLGDGGLMQFPNVVMPDTGPMRYESVGPALAQSVVTWADLAWIRDLWQGPIVVKGVLIGDVARRAADARRPRRWDAPLDERPGSRFARDAHAPMAKAREHRARDPHFRHRHEPPSHAEHEQLVHRQDDEVGHPAA